MKLAGNNFVTDCILATVETEMSVQSFNVEIFSKWPFLRPAVTHTVRYFTSLYRPSAGESEHQLTKKSHKPQ